MKRGELDLATVMSIVKNNVMANLNCHNIGKIDTFYPETQTADIQLMQVKRFNDNYYNLPLLLNVPILVLGSGNANITLPIESGTICLVFFMDRDITSFLETGETYTPDTGRMHDFTDCLAFTTFKTDVDPITDYETEAINIQYQISQSVDDVVVNYYSWLKNYGSYIELFSSQGGQVTVAEKLIIQNTSQNLLTLMTEFLTACSTITVDTETGAILSASAQQFTELITKFEELLQ